MEITTTLHPTREKIPLKAQIRSYMGTHVIIDEPTYTYLRVIPSTSVRNYKTGEILKLLNDLYRDIQLHVDYLKLKICYAKTPKVSYYIYIGKTNVEFYFIVPKKHYLVFKQKIKNTWKNKVVIEEVDEIPIIDPTNCSCCYMSLKDVEAYSLTTDERNNEYLQQLLNITNVLSDGDKVAILFNFIPTKQKYWIADYEKMINRKLSNFTTFKADNIIMKVVYLFMMAVYSAEFIADLALETITGTDTKKAKKTIQSLDLTKATDYKKRDVVTKTQILCMSQSDDFFSQMNNLSILANSFEIVGSKDNELKCVKIKKKKQKKIDILDKKIKGVEPIRLGLKEVQNLISVPAGELLQEFPLIEHKRIRENTEIPSCHTNGVVVVGDARKKSTSETMPVYLCTDYNNGGSVTCSIGLQGCGKSTFQENYAKNVIDNGNCLICIDYIKDCELSRNIEAITPKDRLVVVDFSDFDRPQSFSFTELRPTQRTADNIIDIANRKAQQMTSLINSLTVDGGEVFAPAMSDIVINSSTVLYAQSTNASMKDLYNFLTDYDFRMNVIRSLHPALSTALTDQIKVVERSLNAKGKGGDDTGQTVSSTTLTGILTRISLLRNDYRLSKMFNSDASNNIDLVDNIDKRKVILFRLPQSIFSTTYSKDTIVCYLVSRIWNAMLMLGEKYTQPAMTYLMIDELFQCPTTLQRFSKESLMLQQRKFGLRTYITCQHIKQYKVILDSLKSTGCNFLFMKGSINSYNEFQDELEPFTKEDVVNIPQYSALVSLCNGGDKKFNAIVQLPKPINKKK